MESQRYVTVYSGRVVWVSVGINAGLAKLDGYVCGYSVLVSGRFLSGCIPIPYPIHIPSSCAAFRPSGTRGSTSPCGRSRG
eukprot:1710777-Pyramimonas_sp.AAC.1